MNANTKLNGTVAPGQSDARPAIEVRDLRTIGDFSIWLDGELARLEAENSEFVTRDSLSRDLNCTRRSGRSR